MNLSKETLELIEKEAGKHQSGTQSWHQTKRNSFRQGAEIALTTPSIYRAANLYDKEDCLKLAQEEFLNGMLSTIPKATPLTDEELEKEAERLYPLEATYWKPLQSPPIK